LEYKRWDSNTSKTGSTILKEWTTPDCRNTTSTTNLEGEEIVDAPGKDDNASMPEQVQLHNQWSEMIMIIIKRMLLTAHSGHVTELAVVWLLFFLEY
jgi:hypothetical protein